MDRKEGEIMKKFIVSICLVVSLLIPTSVLAKAKQINESQDWMTVIVKDDFTDVTSYRLRTKNCGTYDNPGISIWFKEGYMGAVLKTGVFRGCIYGVGIIYRVDGKIPVVFDHSFYKHENNLCLDGAELNQLIKDFKAGEKVVYEIYTDNKYVTKQKETISLIGFTRLFNDIKERIKNNTPY